jgi:PAS domain-containing protein
MAIKPTGKETRPDLHAAGSGDGNKHPQSEASTASTSVDTSTYSAAEATKPVAGSKPAIAGGVLLAQASTSKTDDDERTITSTNDVIDIAVGDDGMSIRRSEYTSIVRYAVTHLPTLFKPDSLTKGKIPTDKRMEGIAIRALRYGYKESTGETASRGNSEISKLIKPFTSYLKQNTQSLGLVGTREPVKKSAATVKDANGNPLPAKTIAAQRIFAAISMVAEIEGYAARIPEHYVIGFLIPQQSPTPEGLLADAKAIAKKLSTLGGDVKTIEQNLKSGKKIAGYLEQAQNIRELRDDMRLLVVDSTISPDYERADYFMGFINNDINLWVGKYKGKTSPELLKDGVRVYIAYWLADTMGDTHERLTHRQSSFENAALVMERSIKSDEERKAFRGPFTVLIHSLVRLESKRSRLKEGPDRRVEADPASMMQPPSSNTIIGRDGLEKAIGADLLANFDEFYTKIRGGAIGELGSTEERRSTAVEFFELFFHYIRYAVNTYGDNLLPELKERGLEARFIHAIFNRVQNAHLYTDESLTMLRAFFIEHISETAPSIDRLVPSYLKSTSALSSTDAVSMKPDSNGYIQYVDGMGVKEFIAQVPGMTPQLKSDFYDKTGITWDSFLNWGSVRTNPEKLSEADWEAMVDFAAEEDRRNDGETLTALLLGRRPDGISQENWEARINEAKGNGMLVVMAKGHRPDTISTDEWTEYTDAMRRTGRLENVTVEPRMGKALDAILSAYHFMRDVARDSGVKIDLFEYIASIYPIARRLLARSDDGTIRINIPEFMRSIEFRNWGYHKIAQKISESDDVSDHSKSTLAQHIRGKVDNPEYYIIKRYTTDLAESSRGGAVREAELYDFIAGMLRWVHVLDGGMPVYDIDGSLMTYYSATEIDTQHSFELYYDRADYSGKKSATARLESETLLDVRRGLYRRQIEFAEQHIDTLRSMPIGIQLLDPNGDIVELSALALELKSIQQDDLLYSALLADRSQTAALRSEDDTELIRNFYAGVRNFTERITFFTRALGSLETPAGSIAFQIVPNVGGHTVDRINGKHVTVMLDDIIKTSTSEEWGGDRISNAIRLRIILSHLEAIGETSVQKQMDLAGTIEAASPYWLWDGTSLNSAALDQIRLSNTEGLREAPDFNDSITAKPSGGRTMEASYEPYLPARRKAPGWRQQFIEFAESRDLTGETIDIGLQSIKTYFETVKFFHRNFWPNTLSQIIDDLARDGKESNALYKTAVDFFPRISVINKAREDRQTSSADGIESQLAQWAVEDYVDLFPMRNDMERTRIPVDAHLLNSIVSLHIDEHIDQAPERSPTQHMARQLLDAYNRGAKQVEWSESEYSGSIQMDGLLQESLATSMDAWISTHGSVPNERIVRRAYFHLLPLIRERKTITLDNVESAIVAVAGNDSPSSVDTEFLFGFASQETRDIEALIEIVNSDKIGIKKYTDNNYTSSYIDSSNLELLATAFVVRRLTENLPVDLKSASIDIVGEAFAPYADITNKVASFYMGVLENWLTNAETMLTNRVELYLVALEEAGADATTPPKDLPELISMATSLAEETSFVDVIEAEHGLSIIGNLIGSDKIELEGLTDAAERIFREDVSASVIAHEQHIKGLEEELSSIADRVTDVQERSLNLYIGFNTSPDIQAMDSSEVGDFIARAEAGLEILFGLQGEVEALADLQTRAADIVDELGHEPALKRLSNEPPTAKIASIIKSTDEILTAIDENITQWHPIAEARLGEALAEEATLLAEQKALAAANTASQMVERVGKETSSTKEEMQTLLGEIKARESQLIELIDAAGESYDDYALASDGIDELRALSDQAVGMLGELDQKMISLADELLITLTETEETLRETGDQPKLKTALQELQVQPKVISDLTGSIAEAQQSIDAMHDPITAQLEVARSILPISPATGLVAFDFTARDVSIIDGHSFNYEDPKYGLHEKTQKEVQGVIDGVIISTKSNSYLLSSHEYRTLLNQIKNVPSNGTHFTDIFGTVIALGTNEVFRVANPQNMEQAHPFQMLVNNLATSVSENDLSLNILLKLHKHSRIKLEARKLLNELLSVMASSNSIDSPGAAHTLIRNWALIRRKEITKALGIGTHFLFVNEMAKSEADDPLPPLVKLARDFPESTMVIEHILKLTRQAKTDHVSNNDFTTPRFDHFLFMDDFSEFEGAITLDIFSSQNGDGWKEALRIYKDYLELKFYGGEVDRDAWVERFVAAHTHPAYLKGLRQTLSFVGNKSTSGNDFMAAIRPPWMPEDSTVGAVFTGMERPWEAKPPLLPSWDANDISRLPMSYIEKQIDALGILPKEEWVLEALMDSWRETEKTKIDTSPELALSGLSTSLVKTTNTKAKKGFDALPDVYIKAMLVIKAIDPEGSLYETFRYDIALETQSRIKANKKKTALQRTQDRIRFAYNFILDHRSSFVADEIGNPNAAPWSGNSRTILGASDISRVMPEAGRVKPDIIKQHIARSLSYLHSFGINYPEGIVYVEGKEYSFAPSTAALSMMLLDFQDIPEIAGAIIIDSAALMLKEEWGDVLTIISDYLRATPQQRNYQEYWIDRIVESHSSPKYLEGVRTFLSRPLDPADESHGAIIKVYGGRPGMTIAEAITGSKTPWKDPVDDDDNDGGNGTPSGTPPTSTPSSSGSSTPQTPAGSAGQGTSSMESGSGFSGFFDAEAELVDAQSLGAQHMLESDGRSCIDPTLIPNGSGHYYFTPGAMPMQSVAPTPIPR